MALMAQGSELALFAMGRLASESAEVTPSEFVEK
jgi:hypothetical protein